MASKPLARGNGVQNGRSVTICYYREIPNGKTSHSSVSSDEAGQAGAARPAVTSLGDGGGITAAVVRRSRGARP